MSEIDDLPPLRDVIERHGLWAEKKLGQNFLLDLNVTDKIARAAQIKDGATVFEIGPGPGGLTRSLLKSPASKIIAIEFDPRAVAALQELADKFPQRLEIINADALATDLLGLNPTQGPRHIVANLPYNIATPLLLGWLAQIHAHHDAYQSMTLMFQKEVAQRIVAGPDSKDYGRLSVMTQWLCNARIAFDLPGAAFTPPPKVKSAIVHIVPKDLPDSLPPFSAMEAICAAAFGQRRKMLRSSLKDHLPVLELLGISPELRAENLSVEDFAAIAAKSWDVRK